MNKFFLIFLCFLCCNLNAQKKKTDPNKKITEAKISFLKAQLKLNPKASEEFWPIYNQHKAEILKLSVKKNSVLRKITFKTLTESQAKIYDKEIELIEKSISEKKQKFIYQIRDILTYSQIIKLRISETRFRRKLFEKIKKEN